MSASCRAGPGRLRSFVVGSIQSAARRWCESAPAAGPFVAEVLEGRRLLSAVTWTAADNNGLWTDPLNWTGGSGVPTATDSVTIDAPAQAIILPGSQSVSSLILTSGVLRVQGSNAGNHASLTVSGDVTNHGTMLLESIDGAYNENLTVGGTLANAADGTVQVNAGAGAGRTTYGHIR